MVDSAPSIRAVRRAQTARGLRETARRLTAEHGLAGFTVEELCDRVGVSRRTFFNYFASKEHAIFGVSITEDASAAEDRFVAAGPGASLLADLVELHLSRWSLMELTVADMALLIAAFEREPRLLANGLRLLDAAEQKDIALVERRTGLPAGDIRAATAVQVVGALLKATMDELVRTGTTDDLPTLLRRRLDTARALFRADSAGAPDPRPETGRTP